MKYVFSLDLKVDLFKITTAQGNEQKGSIYMSSFLA